MKNWNHIAAYLRKGIEVGLSELELLAQLEEMGIPIHFHSKLSETLQFL